MTSPLLDGALSLAARGYFVFPLRPRSKETFSKDDLSAPDGKGGFYVATTDAATIRAWWARWPDANIGIDCERSRLAVLDPDAEGLDAWATLRQERGIDDQTITALTGGGGQHLYYRTADVRIPSDSTGKLGFGIHVKSAGGYVVAPPSIHPSGRPYQWEAGYSPDDREPLPLPDTLLRLLKEQTPNISEHRNGHEGMIKAGTRNTTLHQIGSAMRARGALLENIETALLLENQARCKPPLPDYEVLRIAASAGAGDPSTLFRLTDLGNAERFVAQHGQDLFWVREWGWLVWDGTRWQKEPEAMLRLAVETVRTIYRQAAEAEDAEQRKALADHARRSESRRSLEAMISIAETFLAASTQDFDTDAWLFNCENGTVDLRTGELRPHERSDRITKRAPVAFNSNACCPLWLKTLTRIMADRAGLVDFWQRYVGYCLTGDISEHAFGIAYGKGSNGKTTMFETISGMMGDYAIKTRADTLMVKRSGGVNNDIADLRGARLVTAVEAAEGQRLAESLIKELTGGDTIRARFLYHEAFSFRPSFKLLLATNHKPEIRGTDHAIWRRIRLIPFTVVIPDNEQDRHLTDKLRAEWPGILAWAVAGCLAWQRDGLGTPAEVRQATADYRAEEDVLAEFLEARCIAGKEARSSILYAAYKLWAADAKIPDKDTMSQKRFGQQMAERYDNRKGNDGKYYLGVELKP